MWKDLTMSQRADMMDLYLSKGITSLDDMRSLYDSSISDTVQGTSFSDGGSIHIKPENRGKFTALKERTGHSATWFKEHGTPAQKKMATFALNARHWKHGYGGHIYDGTSEDTQQMDIPYAGELPDVTVMPRRIANKSWDKVQERWVGDMPTYYAVNPETGKEEMLREIGNGKYSTYDDKHVFDVLGAEAAKKEREQWIRNGGSAGDFDKVMLGTLGLGLAPIALPEIAAGVSTALANPYVDAGLTSYFGAHGLNHAISEGIDGWGDAAMTALEVAPLGRLARPMLDAGKQGLQYTTKAIDNATRQALPSYDLYRTVGETTPSVRVRDPYIDIKGLRGADKSYIKIKSSLENLADAKRGNKNEAYYLFAPKDIDILKLRNARFGNGKAYDGPILGSGSVDGKFVSYGEPWMEFAPSEKTALYEMPTGPRRGPNLMATDFRGNGMDYSVNEAYNTVLRDRQFHQDIKNMELDDILQFKRDNYPDLIGGIPTDIYHANQTVIPNKNWNFDKFLKTPFWKYSEDSASGQVQKELMMRWPEAKPLETPTIEWTDAAKPPQITVENAASITPEQWTAAQDAAIARGDAAEVQRLRDLHFKVYAPDTAQQGIMYNASGNSIFNEFTGGRTGLNWFSESEKYAANHGVPRAFYLNEPDIYFGNVPAWIKGTPVSERYVESLKRLGYTDEQIAQKVQEINEAASSTAPAAKSVGMGANNELVTKNNNTAKSADAVTYDDNGVRIPLGERDNFNINDIRYGLIPFGIGLTGYGLYNSSKEK